MRKLFLVLVAACILSGCKAAPVMETIGNPMELPAAAPQREIQVELPGEASVPTMESGTDRYYLCDDYEISIETMAGGDLHKTIRKLTGYEPEDLTVLETERDGWKRYDLVWAAEGEQGPRLGRAAILDDGSYHYALSVLRDAENTEKTQVVWRTVFESFSLI